MSEIKVNKISPRSGTTVTLGDSGDTFTIPAGATINNQGTATNFGATGSASWVTGSIKTATFTATAGEGYFCNTTAGVFTVNLPAGTAGAVVAVKDYAGTFDNNNLTIAANGSDKIGGSTRDVTMSTEGIAITLVFMDSTQGWLVTDSGLQSEASQAAFVTATGGTITTSGNFKIHTFTGPGTFCVSCAGNPCGSVSVDYMVVGGAAGGGDSDNGHQGGGGGAGGFRESSGAASGCYTASPLGSGVSALPVSIQGYPITVGAGGAAGDGPQQRGAQGSNSIFSTITSAGGGQSGAGSDPGSNRNGQDGGSGGGSASSNQPVFSGGNGNTPPVSPPQGNNGGSAGGTGSGFSGSGGGATGTGSTSPAIALNPGGTGATTSINASPTTYSTGGANTPGSSPGGAGSSNTGNGGNGGYCAPGGAGGSGIVVIRYKFQ